MDAELLQRLKRMGTELEHLRTRLAELAVLHHRLRASHVRPPQPQHADPDADPPTNGAGLPVAVENGLEEFLRAYV